jgi:hypothetical protein
VELRGSTLTGRPQPLYHRIVPVIARRTIWEVLENQPGVAETSKGTTGWHISGGKTAAETGEAREAAERKRTASPEGYLWAANLNRRVDDTSSAEQVDEASTGLRDAMTGMQDILGKRKRWCLRSKC